MTDLTPEDDNDFDETEDPDPEYWGAGTETQCKNALKLLLDTIPEELHGPETYEASDRLYTLISNAYDL